MVEIRWPYRQLLNRPWIKNEQDMTWGSCKIVVSTGVSQAAYSKDIMLLCVILCTVHSFCCDESWIWLLWGWLWCFNRIIFNIGCSCPHCCYLFECSMLISGTQSSVIHCSLRYTANCLSIIFISAFHILTDGLGSVASLTDYVLCMWSNKRVLHHSFSIKKLKRLH